MSECLIVSTNTLVQNQAEVLEPGDRDSLVLQASKVNCLFILIKAF